MLMVLPDLHLESSGFTPDPGAMKDCDVVVLAGDVHLDTLKVKANGAVPGDEDRSDGTHHPDGMAVDPNDQWLQVNASRASMAMFGFAHDVVSDLVSNVTLVVTEPDDEFLGTANIFRNRADSTPKHLCTERHSCIVLIIFKRNFT